MGQNRRGKFRGPARSEWCQRELAQLEFLQQQLILLLRLLLQRLGVRLPVQERILRDSQSLVRSRAQQKPQLFQILQYFDLQYFYLFDLR